ncbi:hypothetical protein MW887_001557 [Aspergillus wentii]|nr:hypothetical protein MW887_001557 [Aspergillus wentii]
MPTHDRPSHRHRPSSRSQSPDPNHSHRHSRRRTHRDRDSHSRERERERSPDRGDRHSRRHHRSHHGHRHHRHHDRRERHPEPSNTAPAPAPVVLPYQARELSKRDLPVFEPMFAMYLDIQKGIILEDLNEEEVKGRWKSFLRKWNRGELAEGWYDPSTLERARSNAQEQSAPFSAARPRRTSPDYEQGAPAMKDGMESDHEDDDDDEDYGPTLPQPNTFGGRSGPSIPTMQDLQLRKESAIEDAISARQDSRKQHRTEVRSHRSEMRHIEDEIAPRAEPGTHERRMEKQRETAAANRAFAESRRGGSPTDAVPEEEMMGLGENELESLKKAQESERRKKNEREIKREEILRARAAEREERLQQYRQKEDETIVWLKTLAKQRFG